MFAWLAGLFSEAPEKKKTGRFDVSLYLTPELKDRILKMQEESGAKDLAEVFCYMFPVYEELLEIEKRDGLVIIEDADGQKKRLIIRPKRPAKSPTT